VTLSLWREEVFVEEHDLFFLSIDCQGSSVIGTRWSAMHYGRMVHVRCWHLQEFAELPWIIIALDFRIQYYDLIWLIIINDMLILFSLFPEVNRGACWRNSEVIRLRNLFVWLILRGIALKVLLQGTRLMMFTHVTLSPVHCIWLTNHPILFSSILRWLIMIYFLFKSEIVLVRFLFLLMLQSTWYKMLFLPLVSFIFILQVPLVKDINSQLRAKDS
jgi:hypothetical protein